MFRRLLACVGHRDIFSSSDDLVEQNHLWVIVVHFLYVTEDVLFGDDAEEAAVVSDQGLSQPQLPEHVDYRLHRRLVSDASGRQVQNFTQPQRR